MIEPKATFTILVTPDLEPLREFYVRVFGFEVAFFDASFYLHLVHPGCGAQLAFMRPDHPTQPEFLHPASSTEGTIVTFEVDDLEVAHKAAAELGLAFALPPTREDWGQHHFIVRDPAGFAVDIVKDER